MLTCSQWHSDFFLSVCFACLMDECEPQLSYWLWISELTQLYREAGNGREAAMEKLSELRVYFSWWQWNVETEVCILHNFVAKYLDLVIWDYVLVWTNNTFHVTVTLKTSLTHASEIIVKSIHSHAAVCLAYLVTLTHANISTCSRVEKCSACHDKNRAPFFNFSKWHPRDFTPT